MNEKLLLYKLRSLDDGERAQVWRFVRHLKRLERWYKAGQFTRKVITRILSLFTLA